ncbi:hypothetical protein J1605_013479 [Eschrichtius robustus]|uniref:Uncharacterized protein n=1 Tax=Eschrichtius robustus TaxID=9764 RepID=A0AB34GIG3_ESCRO|nr:hypothetical protein J1605_013479 [Eschrichtius robustus]
MLGQLLEGQLDQEVAPKSVGHEVSCMRLVANATQLLLHEILRGTPLLPFRRQESRPSRERPAVAWTCWEELQTPPPSTSPPLPGFCILVQRDMGVSLAGDLVHTPQFTEKE